MNRSRAIIKQKIAVRVDANSKIGGGHLKRCIALGIETISRGHDIVFVLSSLDSSLERTLKSLNFNYELLEPQKKDGEIRPFSDKTGEYNDWLSLPVKVDALKTSIRLKPFSPNWIIYDNYALDFIWVNEVKKTHPTALYVAIDDLDNRKLGCDFLLDQTAILPAQKKHKTLATLSGPSFALIGNSYRKVRKRLAERKNRGKNDSASSRERRILVSVGTFDTKKVLPKIIRAISSIENVVIDVATASASKTSSELKGLADRYQRVNLHLDYPEITNLMSRADLCIGAGGMSVWERCCLGLPSITIPTASNQRKVIQNLKKSKVSKVLTLSEARQQKVVKDLVLKLLKSKTELELLSKNSLDLCDGLGTKRFVDFLESKLSHVEASDSTKLLSWRNSHFVRSKSLNARRLSEEEHSRWMKKTSENKKGVWFIYSEGTKEIGHCNALFLQKKTARWSFYVREKFASKGYGTRMLTLFLKYLFSEKSIRTIKAEVLKTNEHSRKVHKHFGFKQEKIFGDYTVYSLKKDRFHNIFFNLNENLL